MRNILLTLFVTMLTISIFTACDETKKVQTDTDETADEIVDETADEAADEAADETADETADNDSEEVQDIDQTPTIPEITSTPPEEKTKEGYPYLYNIVCEDLDGDALTIELEYGCDGDTLTDNGDGTAVYRINSMPSNGCGFYILCKDSENIVGQEVSAWTLNRFSLVKNIKQSNSSSPGLFNEVDGNFMFFSASDGLGLGASFYTSDGIAAGTLPFHYITGSLSLQMPPKRVGNKVVFIQNVKEIWVTDGTESGTKKLLNTCERNPELCNGDSGSGNIESWVGDDTYIYFSVRYSTSDGIQEHDKIWSSDGTVSGTKVIYDGKDRADDMKVHAVSQSKLFFTMSTDQFDYTNGYESELNYMDKDGGNVTITKKLINDSSSAGANIEHATDIGNKLIFEAQYSVASQHERGLFATDIAQDSTYKITTLDTSTYAIDYAFEDKKNQRAFLIVNDSKTSGQYEIWVIDGAVENVVKLGAFDYNGASETKVYDGVLYFVTGDGNSNFKLWKSDGTVTGTKQIIELGNRTVDYMAYYEPDKMLYFATEDDLYVSDGTEAETEIISKINVRSRSQYHYTYDRNDGLYTFNSTLFISGSMSGGSYTDVELYKYELVW